MKPVRISHHAKNRMRWYDVDESLVMQALRSPDLRTTSIKGRANSWLRWGKEAIRVTYVERAREVVVVSVLLRPHLPRRRR